MATRELPLPEGYDPVSQRVTGTWAASLDDQLRRLRVSVTGLDVAALEWQIAPGHNTIGMLLAHLALVEIGWIQLAPRGAAWHPDGPLYAISRLGIEDDGIPLDRAGAHPEALRGITLAQYDTMLARAREDTHATLRTWGDEALERPIEIGEHRYTRGWILYHVLEHFAAHHGQIGLILHLRRDDTDG